MGEVLVVEKRVDFSTSEAKTRDTIAHELLLQQTGAAQLTTLPLPRDGGALLIEWKEAPSPLAGRLVDAATPFVPVLLDLVERARPNAFLFAARRAWEKAGANRR